MAHPQDISNFAIKFDFPMFLHKRIWEGHNFCTFPAIDIDLAQMILGQCHERPSGHKQFLCEERTTIVYPSKKYDRTDGQTDRRQIEGQTDEFNDYN